jgi:hypothetical protein
MEVLTRPEEATSLSSGTARDEREGAAPVYREAIEPGGAKTLWAVTDTGSVLRLGVSG